MISWLFEGGMFDILAVWGGGGACLISWLFGWKCLISWLFFFFLGGGHVDILAV